MEGAIIENITRRVNEMIAEDPALFLVEVKVKPTNNIKVFIDGDMGISIDKLVLYNRKLYRQLEESGWFPGDDFSLEVSSPGLEEPLKLFRQYKKNTGRYAEITRKDGTRIEGKLLGVNGEEIMVEEEKGKGKKKEIVQHAILLDDIKTTKIQIKF